MHIDLDQAEVGREFRARFCVVGGGIAGLLLATRLAERGGEVLLLEAGGLELEERSQSLYDADMGGAHHAGTTEGRFRTFGGSSTRWGGQLLPYTADVFQPPTGAPSLGWPIAEGDVAPFYEELQRMLGVDLLPFDAGLLDALKRPAVEFSDDVRLRFSKWIPFAKRNLARTLGKTALAHPRITVVSHANVAELLGDGAGRVLAARVVDYARREFRCQAEEFVVATGTIESSRLLLLSEAAVLNAHEQIGRYFHDHLTWPAAEFISPERERMLERLGPFFVDGTLHTCKLEASSALRAQKGLLAVMAHVTIEEPEDSGPAAVRNLMESVQRGQVSEAIGKNLLPMLRGAGDVARLMIDSRFRQRRAVSKLARVRLHIDLEQAEDARNCIRLSEEKDALGMRKAIVDWRVGEQERDTALRFAAVVRAELERLGLAPREWSDEPVFADTFHAMGGLRMGGDPRTSVVDRDLRVHGVANLHVASCAVSPSGGSSNPTFTLMALALRLAERLTGK
ncbi:MAG TPA: GMC family oxidoreductase [Acidobacteriaceae bacterium]|nr:GMC family oxidoreductase [Acidobacteriaceae bacterium]